LTMTSIPDYSLQPGNTMTKSLSPQGAQWRMEAEISLLNPAIMKKILTINGSAR